MLNEYVRKLNEKLRAKNVSTVDGVESRRVGHGGTAWSAPQSNLRQPQDGVSAQITEITSSKHHSLPMEPEDARMTGGTRSLMRRLTGLNVMKRLPERKRAVKTALTPSAGTPQVA